METNLAGREGGYNRGGLEPVSASVPADPPRDIGAMVEPGKPTAT